MARIERLANDIDGNTGSALASIGGTRDTIVAGGTVGFIRTKGGRASRRVGSRTNSADAGIRIITRNSIIASRSVDFDGITAKTSSTSSDVVALIRSNTNDRSGGANSGLTRVVDGAKIKVVAKGSIGFLFIHARARATGGSVAGILGSAGKRNSETNSVIASISGGASVGVIAGGSGG
jgi:hypothetical protein